ncbi:hypothetical protein MLD38_028466 [Melastoma candidum]|uniref:Uncharacterized protein n=1 Tax=Melastoma candidum TaxID=119954 RepID=A0ACB9N0U0_9MYRT|nr:hypothetical protein MLD38_028466 [Melastoma candidum]
MIGGHEIIWIGPSDKKRPKRQHATAQPGHTNPLPPTLDPSPRHSPLRRLPSVPRVSAICGPSPCSRTSGEGKMLGATRSFRRLCLRNLCSSLDRQNACHMRDGYAIPTSQPVVLPITKGWPYLHTPCMPERFAPGWCQSMSTKGRSMRSKVEKRMRKESGKTLREVRRAKKLRKKLMTDEERLIYNLKRAKKKVALLLQKLKKYELPELPPPRHDPELLTPEQLQAYKKIGFKNKNYVPVGVRGVFGGVVQNMHLHWKFHETVQVCCDNFPKEKIKEMATMLARLSGGIVINIHNVKTIIMFRGRNYRQPKNLIPINTLTKRKALFKARFEQALESQKLNIKKIEQQLRRMGMNPEDPVAMASIQRVASTFFNAIDRKEGTPYVFHDDQQLVPLSVTDVQPSEPDVDSDQEELDKFISEIEDAAGKEWEAEEAAEKEEAGRIRYWNRENFGGRFRRTEYEAGSAYADERRRGRNSVDVRSRQGNESDDQDEDEEWDSDGDQYTSDSNDDGNDSEEEFKASRIEIPKHGISSRPLHRQHPSKVKLEKHIMASASDGMFSDVDNAMWNSEEDDIDNPQANMKNARESRNYRSSSEEEE